MIFDKERLQKWTGYLIKKVCKNFVKEALATIFTKKKIYVLEIGK